MIVHTSIPLLEVPHKLRDVVDSCSPWSWGEQSPLPATLVNRVGQNRINKPYMTVYFVISLPKVPYIHRIYIVLANPTGKPFGGDGRGVWMSWALGWIEACAFVAHLQWYYCLAAINVITRTAVGMYKSLCFCCTPPVIILPRYYQCDH